MAEARCKYRLSNPETAGYATIEALKAAAVRSPELRPCPLHRGSHGTWNWIERTLCAKCENALQEEQE